MASRFARLLAPLAACAVATLVASCCCQRYSSCEKPPCIPSTYSTTFQRLVVTNKHTKPVLVIPTAWDDSHATPVEVPLNNTPALIGPGETKTFPIQVPNTNVDRLVVTYLADDDSDHVPTVETLNVVSGVVMITRCVKCYRPEPDFYTIDATCLPPCDPAGPPECPPPCQPACR